ncbi:MAG: hypothetical protein PHD04_00830 [Candidatus Pacebacteria bacterium]|nr:hypothetical protein [Candidatus Paceibacterota bacterium]
MTVASSTSRIQYNCSGGTTYAFTFGVSETSEIEVIRTSALGVETTLTETTNYTISAVNSDYSSGGTVTTVSTYTDGSLTILRNVPLTQESDFTEGMATLYETFETSLDKLTRIAQQQHEEIARAPKLVASSTITDIALPIPEASKYLGWNSTATNLENKASDATHTAVGSTLVKYLSNYADFATALTAFGSTDTTLVIDTEATISTDTTTPTTLHIRAEKIGGFTIATGKTLTINGPFKAGLAKVFNCVGTGKVVFGSTSAAEGVQVEWWGTNATALQAAINATSDGHDQTIKVGYTTIDIGSSTVTMSKGTQIKGASSQYSKITMNNGSLSFGPYHGGSNRRQSIENLTIINSGSTSKTIDLGDISVSGVGPYECLLRDIYVQGGLYSIYLKNTAVVHLDNVYANNDASGVYPIYADSPTALMTSLSISKSRFTGHAYLSVGGSISGLSISDETVFESRNGYCLQVDYGSINIAGSYFEATASGVVPVLINSGVKGGSFVGNYISHYGNTNALQIAGKGVDVRGNHFVAQTGTTAHIVLTSAAEMCDIGTNHSSSLPYYPIVTDAGKNNRVYPSSLVPQVRNMTSVATSGTTPTSIAATTMTQGFVQVGKGVIMEAAGVIAGTNGTKLIQFGLGDHLPIDLLPAENVTGNYYCKVWVENIAASSQRVHYWMWVGTTLKAQGYYTDAEDLTGSRGIGLRATCANAGDTVTNTMFKIDYN